MKIYKGVEYIVAMPEVTTIRRRDLLWAAEGKEIYSVFLQ
ncbi:type 1 glutamine amidotransferase [Evansella vedderi]|uniref:Type 1 glutamine amidotransferase n=1 Tax=Evansella vedderi TaxID=38282 RepID=A0ABT9ZR07_9BACI|nr:type 1 glutamine amidotransferase [Evansella vedderi]